MATDGNLSVNGRNLVIVCKDVDLLETVRDRLGIGPPIKPHRGGFGESCHRLQWSDRVLYEWLLSIGLMPAESLRLQALAVPDEWFPDFLRGCIDGNGSITVYTDRYHVPKDERHVYERLWVDVLRARRSKPGAEACDGESFSRCPRIRTEARCWPAASWMAI